ncbi:MAG: Gfo/Idh/MocA family oxidoreductase [Hyphomonadaceae bacterium]|nr:Gfo/Idh/MocA family oxidoreductase [Hyphomonadaceae bacterium]MBC6412197.1 Gfo/Idh/MocA family oxidoreductase [Hyphomonadaceae bacterium]
MKIVVAGEGAFGRKHLAALGNIEGIEVVSLAGGVEEATRQVAADHGIAHWSLDLDECLARPGVEAAILVTPTPVHGSQAMQVLDAGKHVLVEIPMADNIGDSRALVAKANATGLKAMVGHVRRFNPPHQWIHRRVNSGELDIQQMQMRTRFFRRSNLNALGEPRSWTDHLLWHHGAHSIDLFMYQTGEKIEDLYAVAGPVHPELGIYMDMGILLRTPTGKICNISLSFNNEGPIGTTFRYICDKGTFVAYYDDMERGTGEQVDVSGVDVSMNGVELMEREFFAAIRENREPNGSVQQILATQEIMEQIERMVTRQIGTKA